MDQLEKAREQQFNEKAVRVEHQAKVEREEFLTIIDQQKTDEEKERKVEEQKKQAYRDH